ncbi:MAG: LysM peptidoglycan-binding protein [Solirubrobacterales bacterium]|nr:LysM peptidoglycan-binding protein [Solirubrobacterales bacterium]
MRRLPLIVSGLLALVPAAAAEGAVPHTVQPGETLWSIAAASNLTTRSLAIFNGLSPVGVAVLGSTIQVPTEAEAAAAMQRAGIVPGAPSGSTGATVTAATTTATAPSESAAPATMGAYSVRLGDSLSAIAARARVPAAQIAAKNGLSLAGPLLAGTVLKLPTGAPQLAPVAAPEPEGAAETTTAVVPAAAPYPAAARLDAGTVGSIAAQQGVPSSLAAAIGWQESGFNNGLVSKANARGVMQIMPGTWQWVQNNLTSTRLDPNSATDNVRAGSLYLGHLLRATGGNVAQAVAGYYQGLDSVRRIGMYNDTQRYVADVLALQHRFGG